MTKTQPLEGCAFGTGEESRQGIGSPEIEDRSKHVQKAAP
jgi:hypothetical protein